MPYSPFERGPHPVGVREATWTDESRDRDLPVMIWYPAASSYEGQDLDPATQDRIVGNWSPEPIHQAAVRDAEAAPGEPGPLVLFSHGFAGFRFESSFLCTHLASHGYLVVGVDHVGCTFDDLEAFYTEVGDDGKPASLTTIAPQLVEDRQRDVPFLIDAAGLELGVAVDSVGICGVSFGGWTSLMSPSIDKRIKASVPLCPGGGDTPRRNWGADPLITALDLENNEAATLMLVADRDSWLPLYGQLGMFRRLAGPARMVIMERADHNHFVDGIEEGHAWLKTYTYELAERYPDENWRCIADSIADIGELMPEEEALDICRGMALAQFDAVLCGDPGAAEYLEGDLEAELLGRGLHAMVLSNRVLAPA